MNYETFINEIISYFQDRLPEGRCARRQTMVKNNHVVYEGITVCGSEITISPSIYLESFFEEYEKGTSFDRVAGEVYDFYLQYESVTCEEDFRPRDYDWVREHLVMQLVNYEKNRELLKEMPSVPFMDLAIIFACLTNVGKEQGFFKIRNEHLAIWNITPQKLYEDARRASPVMYPEKVFPVEDFLPPEMREIMEEEVQNRPRLLVLTNRQKSMGASVVCYEGFLQKLYAREGKSFYLIPASTHEMLALLSEEEGLADDVNRMIRDVNRDMVCEEEYLSDHAYYYDGQKDELISCQYKMVI